MNKPATKTKKTLKSTRKETEKEPDLVMDSVPALTRTAVRG